MKKRFLYLLLSAILISSCGAPVAKFVAPDYSKPRKIAILPTTNQTVDVKGSQVFRKILYRELKKKKYTKLLDISVVDSLLNEEGITDGGQLTTMGNEELFTVLNVDGLMFVELLVCGIRAMDLDAVNRVKANLKLYAPPDKLVWEDEREEKSETKKLSSGDILQIIIGQIFFEFIGKAIIGSAERALLEHECKLEMQKLIKKSLKTLP